jgi:hypothetical protein
MLVKENREFSCTYIIRILIKPALAAVLAKKSTPHIISLRVEVNLFVLSSEIEDRDVVEVGNWAKLKKTFYSE